MRTVLVRISGPDQLGISAELFGVLAGMNAIVRDIEQIVVRRRLTLDVLIEVEKGDDVLKDLLLFGFKRDLKIDVEEVEDEDPRIRGIREGEPLATIPRRLNLNNLTFHLPFDKVEYEPEQFPGLIYRLDYPRVVCLIFGSGKMVITGARDKSEILEAVQFIQDELADLL